MLHVECPGCRQSFSAPVSANAFLRCPSCSAVVQKSARPSPIGLLERTFKGAKRKPAAAALLAVITLYAHAGEAILRDAAPLPPAGVERRYIGAVEATASSQAVAVSEGALAHTSQVLPLDERGSLSGKDKPAEQVSKAFDNLSIVLGEVRSDLDGLVKLNVVVARDDIAAVVTKELMRRLPKTVRPAVSFVTSPLPHPDALVGLDAVAITAEKAEQVRFRTSVTLMGQPGTAHAAVMPAGARVYVSGQAEKGDLAAATRKTLEGLRETLKYVRLTDRHIVQVKSFLTPMIDAAVVEKEMAGFFGKEKMPPLVFVEWKASKELPIEIELIAHAGKAYYSAPDVIDFLTPPKTTASPIYSRVTKVHYGPSIYLSGIHAKKDMQDAKAETADVLDQLKAILTAAGSDLNHLAKATYYVSSDSTSKALNALRPKYYDPKRPPAASKAVVASVTKMGRALTLDMIAVPTMKVPATPPEVGHGLKPQEAAEGWISLFDGQTAFGWKAGQAEKGLLIGGATTSEFGKCAVKADVAEVGTLKIGVQEVKVTPGEYTLADTGGKGVIELMGGVKLRSLAIKPLRLKALFNGRDMEGWEADSTVPLPEAKRPVWKVEKGALIATGGPGAMQYEGGKYGDFVLQIDVKTRVRHANGGVFLRAIPDDFMNGYEAQVYNRCRDGDPSKPEVWATGAIDDRQNTRRLVSRDFEYYRMTVIARGPHLATWINGYQVTDFTDARPPDPNPRKGLRVEPGVIQLQAHDPQTDVEFKHIRIGE